MLTVPPIERMIKTKFFADRLYLQRQPMPVAIAVAALLRLRFRFPCAEITVKWKFELS